MLLCAMMDCNVCVMCLLKGHLECVDFRRDNYVICNVDYLTVIIIILLFLSLTTISETIKFNTRSNYTYI
jgi:hypothetical protein